MFLLKAAKATLEERVPSLTEQQPNAALVNRLKEAAKMTEFQESIENDFQEAEELDEPGDDEMTVSQGEDQSAAEAVFSDESHIFDFWEEIAARVKVLEELGEEFKEDSFLGYSKEALISFLRPIVLVDGQHRLQGAVDAAREATNAEPWASEIAKRVTDGEPPAAVQGDVEARASRTLPVSILMTSDPAEHVFQFVVVNQKATPIDRALLGTIVSTSLSNDELSRVGKRLEDSGIELEQSRALTYLSRHPTSPFKDRVERGLSGEPEGRLPWTVLGSLVRIFRELKGGKLYGEKNDYADKWRRSYLPNSKIVEAWSAENCQSAFDYWRLRDGPWRDVFVSFWTTVREELSKTKEEDAPHYWGSSRTSNIFTKVSLTILASDFFQFLCDAKRPIDSKDKDEVPDLVREWLTDVDRNYFNRNWELAGVKKDSTGIRRAWAKIWKEYRKDPKRLPATKLYRQPV